MLSSRIRPLSTEDTTTEDTGDDDDAESLFTAFLPHLFPDEAHACLGDPGQTLLYTPSPSPSGSERQRYGGRALKIVVPTDGRGEAGRELFAHYLWGGTLVIAEGVEAAVDAREDEEEKEEKKKKKRWWDVKGLRVLELGAGAALPSLIATLSGAESVTITDHPSSSALYGPAQTNISTNISDEGMRGRVSVRPHAWGEVPDGPAGDGEPGEEEAMRFVAENKGRFDRIVCADCLWMKSQHENLVRSIDWFLAPAAAKREKGSDPGGGGAMAWVVAGFHTGRAIVASFLDTAVSMGLVVEDVWERDMNAPVEAGEVTREWCPVREGEGPENRARWYMVAFLRKKKKKTME